MPEKLNERQGFIVIALRYHAQRKQIDVAQDAALAPAGYDSRESEAFAPIAALEERGLVSVREPLDTHCSIVSLTPGGRELDRRLRNVDGIDRLTGTLPRGPWQPVNEDASPTLREPCEVLLDGAIIGVVGRHANGISFEDFHSTIFGGAANRRTRRPGAINVSTCRLRSRYWLRVYDARTDSYLLPIYSCGDWPAPELWPQGKLGSPSPVPDANPARLKNAPYFPIEPSETCEEPL